MTYKGNISNLLIFEDRSFKIIIDKVKRSAVLCNFAQYSFKDVHFVNFAKKVVCVLLQKHLGVMFIANPGLCCYLLLSKVLG